MSNSVCVYNARYNYTFNLIFVVSILIHIELIAVIYKEYQKGTSKYARCLPICDAGRPVNTERTIQINHNSSHQKHSKHSKRAMTSTILTTLVGGEWEEHCSDEGDIYYVHVTTRERTPYIPPGYEDRLAVSQNPSQL